jgi:hypothetical protein
VNRAESFRDVERALPGVVKRAAGGRLATSVSPCCGDRTHSGKRRRPTDLVFYATDYGDYWGAKCFVCGSTDAGTFSKLLGLHVGRYGTNEPIDNGDRGPVFPDALVLKAVIPGSYAVGADFGDDRIGQQATYLFGNLIAARCRAFENEPRISFDPYKTPASKDFIARLSRKLGRPISSGRANEIRERIHSRFADGYHYFPKQKAEKVGYRSLIVLDTLVSALIRASKLLLHRFVNPAVSQSSEQRSRSNQSLEAFLEGSIEAHAPPDLTSEVPPTTSLTLARFLGMAAA